MKKLFSTLTALLLCLSVAQAQIVITEIMYNPAESFVDTTEFIELYNAGTTTVDLQNYYFSAGIVDTFLSSTPIPAGGYIVIAVNAGAFLNTYGVAATKQWIGGALANGGESIVLKDGSGVVVDSVFYMTSGDWPTGTTNGMPNGGGASLVLCNPALDNADGTNWTASTTVVGGGLIVNSRPVTASPFATDAACAPIPTTLQVSFASSGITVNENVSTVTVNVTIINPDANPTSVDVVLNAATTATGGGNDYTFAPATLTFPASSTTNQTFMVTITDDAVIESAEIIVLELTNPTNAAVFGNDSIYTITILDNDAPPAIVPNLVITELNYNPASVDSIEFIEIYNNDTMTIDLAGYQLTNGLFFVFPTHNLAPGEFVLVTQDSTWFDHFFGVPTYNWTANSLNNNGEAIVLRNSAGDVVDSVFYSSSAPWPAGAFGTGASIQLCDVNADNANGANWWASTNPTGVFNAGVQVLATPGAANTFCVPPPPTTYTYYPISDINIVNANGSPDSLGVTVELRGVVHCGDFNSGAALEFYLVEYNNVGIKAYTGATLAGYVVAEGDSLHLFGTIEQISGTTEILLDSLSVISSGNSTVTPMVVSSTLTEAHEGSVIQFNNVSLVNASQWTGAGSGFNVDVTNGSNTWQVRIDNDVNLYSQSAPTGSFNIYGFGTQFDPTAPYLDGRQLLACSSSITPVAIETVFGNDNNVSLFPNPVMDVLNVRANNIESILITNMLGQEVLRVQNVNDNYTTINTVALPTGVYNVTVINDGRLSTQQLVKK